MPFKSLEDSSMWYSLHILSRHVSVPSLSCARPLGSKCNKCQKIVGKAVKYHQVLILLMHAHIHTELSPLSGKYSYVEEE